MMEKNEEGNYRNTTTSKVTESWQNTAGIHQLQIGIT